MYFSCQKDQLLYDYTGKVMAEKNAIPWEAKIRLLENSTNPGTYYIGIDAYDEQGFLSEHLYFNNFYLIENEYPLIAQSNNQVDSAIVSDYSTEISGDVLGSTYRLITSYDNHLTIESIKNKCVSGKFQCAFEIEIWGKPGDPDTVYFNNGVFEAKILK